MAFLYGLLRALATTLRKVAALRHTRAKDRYEDAEQTFRIIEADCKAYEVQVGRTNAFGSQLKLLKAYEAKETLRARWIRAAQKLEARNRQADWLKSLSGRKLPYTFGLVDMATVLYILDRFGGLEFQPTEFWQELTTLF